MPLAFYVNLSLCQNPEDGSPVPCPIVLNYKSPLSAFQPVSKYLLRTSGQPGLSGPHPSSKQSDADNVLCVGTVGMAFGELAPMYK